MERRLTGPCPNCETINTLRLKPKSRAAMCKCCKRHWRNFDRARTAEHRMVVLDHTRYHAQVIKPRKSQIVFWQEVEQAMLEILALRFNLKVLHDGVVGQHPEFGLVALKTMVEQFWLV